MAWLLVDLVCGIRHQGVIRDPVDFPGLSTIVGVELFEVA